MSWAQTRDVAVLGQQLNTKLDDWLTVHYSITLVDLQLNAQHFCSSVVSAVSTLFIIINILYYFNNQINLAIILCNFITRQHNLYMTHHAQGIQ
jgi:hypothetical protein